MQDYFRSVKIIDESRPSLGFDVNFFCETMEKLPHVNTIGDIIIVSRVVVNEFLVLPFAPPFAPRWEFLWGLKLGVSVSGENILF